MARLHFLLCVIILLPLFSCAKDLYGLLGLDGSQVRSIDANQAEKKIKDAYKKFVRKNHPNHYRGDDSAEVVKARFVEVTDAYETLSDTQKRDVYDRSGQKPSGAGDNYNYLRHNLFNEDFAGSKLESNDLELILRGKHQTSQFVFFWSSNFPECVEAGGPFKAMSRKLKGSSLRVASINCDQGVSVCREVLLPRFPQLPVALFFPARSSQFVPFKGKFETELLTQFAARHLSSLSQAVVTSSVHSIFDVCPNPVVSFQRSWAGAFLWETHKRCWVGSVRYDLVAFQYSSCYDCDTELNIALDSLAPILPSLNIRRINCQGREDKEACAKILPASKDRAWGVAKLQKRCWYAMKRPFAFSDEHCDELLIDPFEGKYQSQLIRVFLMKGRRSVAPRMNDALFDAMKSQNDAFVVFFMQKHQRTYENGMYLQWELLARHLAEHPIKGNKGQRVKLGTVICEDVQRICNELHIPSVHLYSFGIKAKKVAPHVFHSIDSVTDFVQIIIRDAEPLHLYMLNSRNYDAKLSASVAKGRRWLVLFNAGQWCPPCNQIRPVWREVARMVQESSSAKKLAVAVVECDEQRTLCQKMRIDNMPTMYFIAKGAARREYSGNRDARSIADWAIDSIENKLLKLEAREIHMKIQEHQKIVVAFSAGAWCPPCTAIHPIMKKVALQLPNVQITLYNCDEEQMFCQDYGIEGYPTVKLFHRGAVLEFDGQKTVDAIVQWIKKN